MSRKGKSGKRKKATVKRHSSPSTPKSSKSDASKSRRSRARVLLSIAGKILAVWGVALTTWVVFYPRLFVEPATPLDPNNPAYTPFVVHNQGYLAIHDVKFSCSMKYLKLPGDILVVGLGDYTNRFSDPKQAASVIAAGEKYSELLPLTGMEHNKIENADIAIVLSFKPIRWLPWRRKSLYRFVATQGKDRQWHWLPQPINK